MKDYCTDGKTGFRLTHWAHQKAAMFAAAGIRLSSIKTEASYEDALTVALCRKATNLMTLKNSPLEAKLCKQALSELTHGKNLEKATYLIDKITKLQTWQLVTEKETSNRQDQSQSSQPVTSLFHQGGNDIE